ASLANWADSSTVRLTVPVAPGEAATVLSSAPAPHCIAEALEGGQFLITARGLSLGASYNNNGQLQGGSEVWLQAIIPPTVPGVATEGGYDCRPHAAPGARLRPPRADDPLRHHRPARHPRLPELRRTRAQTPPGRRSARP